MSGSKAALVATFAIMACLDDFHLSASSLEIGPNPAVPGDVVVATFVVLVTPIQRHTIVFMINGEEHTSVTSNEEPSRPYVLTLGDAADLIATYGSGTHLAHVEVHAEEANETARTRSVGFELRQSAP